MPVRSTVRANEWVAGIAEGLDSIKVSVSNVRVEHEVKLRDFTKWLEKNGGSPRKISERQRIRSILGSQSPLNNANVDLQK